MSTLYQREWLLSNRIRGIHDTLHIQYTEWQMGSLNTDSLHILRIKGEWLLSIHRVNTIHTIYIIHYSESLYRQSTYTTYQREWLSTGSSRSDKASLPDLAREPRYSCCCWYVHSTHKIYYTNTIYSNMHILHIIQYLLILDSIDTTKSHNTYLHWSIFACFGLQALLCLCANNRGLLQSSCWCIRCEGGRLLI